MLNPISKNNSGKTLPNVGCFTLCYYSKDGYKTENTSDLAWSWSVLNAVLNFSTEIHESMTTLLNMNMGKTRVPSLLRNKYQFTTHKTIYCHKKLIYRAKYIHKSDSLQTRQEKNI